ncbi:PREDICTED: wiskott-Aldrich syndrome protein family member 2-like [Wasmannia auropunctata]|uniref:wiskott-Aldrich syndrome protein family member 2-like n=1 Tax=Wasmannia auropunctata TaxID=64793 RepID=UPI0005EE8AE3|nr:PREDICTED: wiskott-Aldrich syndrome protein family member 2-like [Wasmannia auropunctata]
MCGSPVMSTGSRQSVRHSPPCLPPLPVIGVASPCAAATPSPPPVRGGLKRTPPPQYHPRPTTPVPERGQQHGAARPSPPDSEGDEGEPWRVHMGRRAGRRCLRDSTLDSESPSIARSRAPASASPTASANIRVNISPREVVIIDENNNNSRKETAPPIVTTPPSLSPGAASRRGTSPEDREEGDTRDGTGDEHSSTVSM